VNEPVLTLNVIDVAADAVVENEDVRAYDAELTVPFTNDAVLAKEAVTGTNVIDVAALDVVANEDVRALLAQLAVPKVDPLWVPMKDPVNDPVLTAKVIDVAADDVAENDEVRAYDAELTVPFTNEAVIANDDEIALLAQLAVPNVEPL
jgi:hypothetical protein